MAATWRPGVVSCVRTRACMHRRMPAKRTHTHKTHIFALLLVVVCSLVAFEFYLLCLSVWGGMLFVFEVLCCSDLLRMCVYMGISAFVCVWVYVSLRVRPCVLVSMRVCAGVCVSVTVSMCRCACPPTPGICGKHIVLRTIMGRSCGPDIINTRIGCVEGGAKNQKKWPNTQTTR